MCPRVSKGLHTHMEGSPDDIGSSPSPFQPFKNPQPKQDDQHPQRQEMMFPSGEASEIVQPPWPLLHFPTTTTTVNSRSSLSNPIIHDRTHMLSSLVPPPLPSRIPYSYEGLLLLPEQSFNLAGGLYVGGQPSKSFGSLQSEFSKMTAQEILDAKALAASKSHSEAERRRRERINGHLAKLRSLLPNTTKTDKASLLAEVIMHVKELKSQTSELAEEYAVPTELDELTIDVVDDDEGRFVVRASFCCDDKPDLLPELVKALKSMRLRAVKAEIVTLGGRVRNVLLITGQDDGCERHSVTSIQEALRAVMEKAATGSAADEPSTSNSGGSKRQRTSSLTSIQGNRSI